MMSSRPGPVGSPTCSLRSKRPGRSRPGSSVEAWLVAPITITLYWGTLGLPRCSQRLMWRHSPRGMIMPSIWISSSLTYMPPMPPMPGAMMIRSGPLAQWRPVSAGVAGGSGGRARAAAADVVQLVGEDRAPAVLARQLPGLLEHPHDAQVADAHEHVVEAGT